MNESEAELARSQAACARLSQVILMSELSYFLFLSFIDFGEVSDQWWMKFSSRTAYVAALFFDTLT